MCQHELNLCKNSVLYLDKKTVVSNDQSWHMTLKKCFSIYNQLLYGQLSKFHAIVNQL